MLQDNFQSDTLSEAEEINVSIAYGRLVHCSFKAKNWVQPPVEIHLKNK